MGILKAIFKTQGFLLILLGILLLFVPVVGLIAGLPLILLGIFVSWKKGEIKKHHAGNSLISNLLLKIKPVTKSKKWLVFFIMVSFALLIFGSADYQLIYIGLILLFFVMYNNVKHEEWKASGKQVSAKWFRIRGRPARWFGAGVFAIIYGLLILIGAIYVADKGYKYEAHHTIADFIGARIAWGFVIGLIGIASIILGFWMIRFSYRNPYYSANFEVLEPGKVVISREGIINNRTLKEYSNN